MTIFLTTKSSTINGKKYSYDVIVEKYKDGNKWKKRELIRLGTLSPEERKNVILWLSLNPGKKENLKKLKRLMMYIKS